MTTPELHLTENSPLRPVILPENYSVALKALQDEKQAESLGQIVPAGLQLADARRRKAIYPEAVSHIQTLCTRGLIPIDIFSVKPTDLARAIAP